MEPSGPVDRWQRRHPVLGLPVATVYKFVEDQGFYLAAIIAFYAMFSLFPAMLLLTSLAAFALETRPGLQAGIVEAALDQVPLLPESFWRRQLTGSGLSLVIGAAGAAYGALGVCTAVQNAINVIWNVPRNERPNPVLLRLRSLTLLALLFVFVLVTTAIAQIDPAWLGTAWPAALNGPAGTAIALVVTTLTFCLVTKLVLRGRITFRDAVPGAVLGAVLWQLLQHLGAFYVRSHVVRATIADGVFSSLLGLMLWIFLAGAILVLSLEFNVVLVEGLYPRSLASVFVDNENLTVADKLVYERMAVAARFKTFERIGVEFGPREGTGTLVLRLRALRARAGAGRSGGGEPGS